MLHEASLTTGMSLLISAFSVVASLWLDKWLGEPKRFHPLVGFGRLAKKCESWCRAISFISTKQQGIVAWCLSVMPLVLLSYLLLSLIAQFSVIALVVGNVVILYLTIGGKSLIEHAENIYDPLQRGDIEQARYQVSMIVSRNTEKMGEKEITSSTIESVLENGNDAVFGPMIWFLIFGAPGAVLFRLANTLDAMWGYKNEKYIDFGWFSAKTDDVLGWLPARVTAVVYALQGNFQQALACWQQQAKECKSPNGGVVMTTGAGSLNIEIGGPTYYHGVLHDKNPMGAGAPASWDSIPKANQLVTRGSFALSYLWLVCVMVGVS
ncbi:adenosylcobinamide-phosphate synthase CbiB [Photobacterium sp. SDRW27]|uniref:adenosylcobinamide-phosphate synthase CbiB n=1 Tax=Photobacterium obscurum TaxID=2829490 RepID=UPI002244CA51|nr:adenosylcobinamide-phosphate synthase CbiB [Photobacterium obscurum]MCW8329131.1 adenosylcobinamide-phosphate synthase CbiB [Photobacterium obscurum]